MGNSIPKIELPDNEPLKDYAPGSPERDELKQTLDELAGQVTEIPLYIGGEEVRTGDTVEITAPHDHELVLAEVHQGGREETEAAIEAAMEAWEEWSRTPWEQRLAVFQKAADLLAGPFRALNNAATMLGQSKNVWQAEIDSAAEQIDFWRFNTYYARELFADQPPRHSRGIWNRQELRPLEGFVFAVSPFNFTSIGANLPTAPAIVGNVAVWKPAADQVLSAWTTFKILREAGLPGGVINFVTGPASEIGDTALNDERLAGVHFTGSVETCDYIFETVGANTDKYNTYPRIVAETGGKDFVFAHPSADLDPLVTAVSRGAWEYQGQKCSAVSRAYLPESLWDGFWEGLQEDLDSFRIGGVRDFRNFINAVINEGAFDKITGYIEQARESDDAEIIWGGEYDDSEGWFIRPTVIRARDPKFLTMREEIFGPVLTVFVYPDSEFEHYLEVCDDTSPYGLTGSIFATDRYAIETAERKLRHAAGNFYINDKPTGAVVGQQPFGGARKSGTDDKAGSWLNLVRWVSPRSIKENFDPPSDYRYPFMEEK